MDFCLFFFEQANASWTKPDPSLLPPLSEAGCKSCQNLVNTAEELEAKGHRYGSRPVTVTKTVPVGGAPSNQQYIRVFLSQHKVDVLTASGAVVSSDAAADVVRNAALVWKEGRWLMYGLAA